MRSVLKRNCGVDALERFFGYKRKKFKGDEYFMSIASFISLANDAGNQMRAYWMSQEDITILESPFIIYTSEHFIPVKHWSRGPWFSLPKRFIVITEDKVPERFERLSIHEMFSYKGAKGETTIQASQPSPQPSTAEAVREWVQSMPTVYETQMRYAPLQAAQEVSLAQQFAQPYGQAMKAAQEALYPGTSRIQEMLANQSIEGMQSGVPQSVKDQYLSDLRANLGTNVGSGIAADYTSRGLLNLNEDWRRYNQNLGLSVTGRQPLTMASTPQTSNYMNDFTPSSVMGFNANTYGSYVGAQANMYGSYTNALASRANSRDAMWGSIIGGGLNAAGTMGGFAMMSTELVKEDVSEFEGDAIETIKNLDVKEWKYIGTDKKRVGIILEESPDTFSETDGVHMDVVTLLGYLTKSVQQLAKKLEDK